MATDLTRTDGIFDVKTEALLADLSRIAERKSRVSRWLRPVIGVGGLYCAVYAVCVLMLHLPIPPAYAGTLTTLENVALGIILLSTIPEWFLSSHIAKSKVRLKKLVDGLATDSRAVGALAQLYRSIEVTEAGEIVLSPLLKLLPEVKAGDARYISDKQMEALLDLLVVRMRDRAWGRGAKLRCAALKALEQIGDSRAIEPVRRLTTGKGNAPYHEAAQECLAVLEQHAEEREYNRTLLLPASEETETETLLRPTHWQAEKQPELLLRAANEESSE